MVVVLRVVVRRLSARGAQAGAHHGAAARRRGRSKLQGDDDQTRERYDVLAIPTFIVLDRPDGRELGRVIIESPRGADGIEGDLLEIATSAPFARA